MSTGISLLTQLLYLLVFLTRYVDLLWTFFNTYNTIFKITYILTSLYTIYLLLKVYPRSREPEKEWRIATYICGFSGILAPPLAVIDSGWKHLIRPDTMMWAFSIALESLAILPQMSLLRFVDIPTAITSYYLIALGSYRFFYLINWAQRALSPEHKVEPVPVLFGIIQTWLYVEFAIVYYKRQKIRLRAGSGLLDDEDFRNSGLILGKILGGTTGGSWTQFQSWLGRRTAGGVSVSADEGLVRPAPARDSSRREGDEEEGRVLVGSDESDLSEDEGLVDDRGKKGRTSPIGDGNVWRH